MPRAFIIRPFRAKPVIGGGEIDFDQISEKLIDPALRIAGFEGGTTETIITSGDIREDMYWLIPTADLVLCDITIPNANVFMNWAYVTRYARNIRYLSEERHRMKRFRLIF
jgi:hypothetical protein